MRTFNIYLAGPITGCSFEDQTRWREEFINLSNEMELDYFVDLRIINPTDYCNMQTSTDYSELEVMKFDLRMVKQSDLIVAKVDKSSIGTSMELATAYNMDIPIIGFNPLKIKLHPWIECCLDKEFSDIESLIWFIKEFYLQ